VIGAKRPSRAGADGEELEAPSFRFTLRKGKKGDGFESKLAKKQYGKSGSSHRRSSERAAAARALLRRNPRT